jgi:hypothetical protein
MNIREFPTEVADELQSSISILHTTGSISLEKLVHLQKWVTSEGYEILTVAYSDWIAANLKPIAEFVFSDADMMSYIGLDDSTTINDSMRIDFVREFLTSERFSIDDRYYPSPVEIELSENNKNAHKSRHQKFAR